MKYDWAPIVSLRTFAKYQDELIDLEDIIPNQDAFDTIVEVVGRSNRYDRAEDVLARISASTWNVVTQDYDPTVGLKDITERTQVPPEQVVKNWATYEPEHSTPLAKVELFPLSDEETERVKRELRSFQTHLESPEMEVAVAFSRVLRRTTEEICEDLFGGDIEPADVDEAIYKIYKGDLEFFDKHSELTEPAQDFLQLVRSEIGDSFTEEEVYQFTLQFEPESSQLLGELDRLGVVEPEDEQTYQVVQ